MPSVNPKCFHQSASSIQAFKACPRRWQLAYREGLRLDRDTDSQRMGTNWHAMHEVYANVYAQLVPGTATEPAAAADAALASVIEHLNERYKEMPDWKTPGEWALERQTLITSFIGYLWFWQNDPVEFLHSELAFDLPLHDPVIGLPLPLSEVMRVGKIDHVIKWQNLIGAMERKSTSRGIEPDSDYWEKSQKDTQVSMYALAFRDMAQAGVLPAGMSAEIAFSRAFGNTLYDVWHKPTIKPAVLTQKATKELIDGLTYCDTPFTVVVTDERDVTIVEEGKEKTKKTATVTVDGEPCEVEPGAKGYAIRETVGMFAARLLADIYERPDFYYARREIARTDDELRKFRVDLYNIYQTQKTMAKTGHFYENESQCRATFACAYIPVCYGPGPTPCWTAPRPRKGSREFSLT
jgi:hypothetical protein